MDMKKQLRYISAKLKSKFNTKGFGPFFFSHIIYLKEKMLMGELAIYKKKFKHIWKMFSDGAYIKKYKNKLQILLNDFDYSDDFSATNDAVLLAEYLQKDDCSQYFEDLCNLYLELDGMKCYGSYTYKISDDSSLIMYHINDLCSYSTYVKYKSNFNGFLCTVTGIDKNQAALIEQSLINQPQDIKVFKLGDTCLMFTIYFDSFDYENTFRFYTEINYIRDTLIQIITPGVSHSEKVNIGKTHFKWFHNILVTIMD